MIVVINPTKKNSFQTFHESTFVKALAYLEVPKDLLKNVKHLQMVEPAKMETTKNDSRNGRKEEKMVVLNLSTLLVLLFYISLIFFSFLFKSSLGAMWDILIRLSDFLKKLSVC